jgi:hypothetical protein
MRYEIIIRGYVQEKWFEGFMMTRQPDFNTKLQGCLMDQSALYGVLRTIHDLGLDLISVSRVDEGE